METISFKHPGERAKRDLPGVEAVVLSKIGELSLDAPLELVKLIAWVHTLKDKDVRDRCKDLIQSKFVAPHAMSHDQYEYDRAQQLSDVLSSPEDALTALKEYTSREFAHRAGSEGATSEWDAESLIKQLGRVVQDRKGQQAQHHRSVTESGERIIVRDSEMEAGDAVPGMQDELGGPVDAEAHRAYSDFTKSDRFVA